MGMKCTGHKCDLSFETYRASSLYDPDRNSFTLTFPGTKTRTLKWRVQMTDDWQSSVFYVKPGPGCTYTFMNGNLAYIEMW